MTTNQPQIAEFVEKGWFVFPLQPGSKYPYKDFHWGEESSDSMEDVKQWQEEYPDCNWGLDCGKSELTVIDLDVKNGVDGIDNYFNASERDGCLVLNDFKVRTPSKGLHLYYQGSSSSSAGKLAKGVDTRSEGGYVLLPGSKINGDEYTLLPDSDVIPKLPEKLKEIIGIKKVREYELDAVVELDQPGNIADAIAYLQSAPPGVLGARNDTAYKVACMVRDFGTSDVTTTELMLRFWNERCQPPLDFEELKTVISSSYQYAESPAGSKTAEGNFTAVVQPKKDILADDRPKKLSDFVGQPADRDWIIEGWLPTGEISSLYGDGGVGKSLLALQLGLAVASGGSFCGIKVQKPMPVLAVMAEDSDDELHRRIHAIRGIPEYQFGNPNNPLSPENDIPFYLWSRAGKDAVIANIAISDAKITIAEFGTKLDAQLGEMGEEPKLLILDTLADIFCGDENNRQVVNRFVKVVLGGIAKDHNATILMLAHPSKTSASDGTYYSGSTAWNNAVRNRLVLKPHQIEELKDMRILERVKSNYAQTGETITLQWERGAFKVVTNEAEMADDIQLVDDQTVYNAIRDHAADNNPVAMRTGTVNPLMHLGLKNTQGKTFKFNDLKRIVGRLQKQRQIVTVSGQRRGNGLWPTEDLRKYQEINLFKTAPIIEPEELEEEWL